MIFAAAFALCCRVLWLGAVETTQRCRASVRGAHDEVPEQPITERSVQAQSVQLVYKLQGERCVNSNPTQELFTSGWTRVSGGQRKLLHLLTSSPDMQIEMGPGREDVSDELHD